MTMPHLINCSHSRNGWCLQCVKDLYDSKQNLILLDRDERDYLLYREGSGESIEIFDIAVGTERGVGKGRRLVQMLEERVKGDTHLIWAITRDSNAIAQQFYTRIGFRVIAYLRGFYRSEGHTEDAIMYGKDV